MCSYYRRFLHQVTGKISASNRNDNIRYLDTNPVSLPHLHHPKSLTGPATYSGVLGHFQEQSNSGVIAVNPRLAAHNQSLRSLRGLILNLGILVTTVQYHKLNAWYLCASIISHLNWVAQASRFQVSVR